MTPTARTQPLPAASPWSADLPASLVVFLVAVPLSVGIASGSSAPVMAGLIAAAIGGIVVGLLGGAPLLVSGPAAGLMTLTAGAILSLGFTQALAAFALAGAIQLGAGVLRLGRYFLAVPPAVVHGMLAGIGVIIATQQLRRVLGGNPTGKTLDHLAAIPALLSTPAVASIALGAGAFLILLGWEKVPKRFKVVPGALLAVGLPTLAATLLNLDVKRVDLPKELADGFVTPSLPTNWSGVVIAALTIAFIASVESLLSAVATDKLHDGKRARLDKELVGQGAANLLSGLVGGLPITGVIVRSKANIDAGARTRASAILHGVWIIVFVAFLGFLIESIPLAVLGGLLVHVGFKLVNPAHIRELAHHRQLPAYIATLAGVVFEDLLIGVALGVIVYFVWNRALLGRSTVRRNGDTVWTDGRVSTLTVPGLMTTLTELPAGAPATLRLPATFDHAAFEAVHAWAIGRERTGDEARVVGPGAARYYELAGHSPIHDTEDIPESGGQ